MTDEHGIDQDKAWQLYLAAQQAVVKAQAEVEEALRLLVHAAGSKTFYQDGHLYQYRERMNAQKGYKVPFLCVLRTTPQEAQASARTKKQEESLKAKIEKSFEPLSNPTNNAIIVG